jgi:hypothetical protein
MTKEELALECVRLAIPLVSPSVDNRFNGIAELSEKLYSHITTLVDDAPEADKPKRKYERKPRAEE